MNRNILNSKIYNKEHQRIVDSEIKKACALNSITESELREFALDTPLAPVVKFFLYVAFAVVLMTFADGRHEQAFWIWSTAMIFALAWRYHVLKASIRFFMSKDNRQTYKAVKSTLRALQKVLKPINKQQAKAETAHEKRSKRGVVVASVNEAVEKRMKAEREASAARSPARSSKASSKDSGGDYLSPGSVHGSADNDSTSSSSSDSGSSSGGDGGGGD
ncbi:hypothetical protein [Pseudomonas putida]|uniref:hypothetical protein n=1 Tax=Pseudomonas putida TaxID=303 RepID=UPI000A93AF14|nr:hypothetical protein [Pseudomonas putida]